LHHEHEEYLTEDPNLAVIKLNDHSAVNSTYAA